MGLDFITRVDPGGIFIDATRPAYGADPTGTTDATAEINLAITAAKSLGAGLILPGTFKVSGSLLFEDIKGMLVAGSGASLTSLKGTRFIWDGNATDPAFHVFGCRDCTFENFTVISSSTKPLAAAFQSETRSGSVSTWNLYQNIIIEGTNLNGLLRGFKFMAGTGGDANNSDNVFRNVHVNNYTNYGWDFQHAQSTVHRFYAVGANAASGATTSASIISVPGVSYEIYGANLNLNGEADIIWPGANQGLLLMGVFSENSSRFLKTTGGSVDANAPVSIIGGAWNTTALNADGRVIDFRLRGPLNIRGWSLVGNTSTAAAIYFNCSPNGVWSFTVSDCLLTTSLSPTTMFTSAQPNSILNCVFAGASTVLVPEKHNNVSATPSFETLGVGTGDNSDPTPAKLLVDGVQRIRQSKTVTRYRADTQVSSGGLGLTIYDDTGAVFIPWIVNSSTFEIWPNGVQANRVQVDASGNLQAVNGHIEALGSGKQVHASGGIGVGNSTSATTPGSVVKKVEIFDVSGTSLGFLAVYSSIT